MKILESSNYKIALVGNNLNNASRASGAMIAVHGELEDSKLYDYHDELLLNLSENASLEWRKIIKKIDNNIITAKKTFVYLKNNANNLEKKCFKVISKYGKFLKNVKNSKINTQYLVLNKEFAISSKSLFKKIDAIISKNKNIMFFNDQANINNVYSNKVTLKNSNKIISSNKILIAAGSNSSNIIRKYKMVPVYHGVGTALEIKSEELYNFINKDTVYRTANRGGSFCGVHLVPRDKLGSFYLGAGNYLSNNYNAIGRMATVKYLIDALTKEISNEEIVHKTMMKMVYGNRPISFDNKPVFGTFDKNKKIFVASGFNRVGLTVSPIITEEILKWIGDKHTDSVYDIWKPNREFISFKDKDYAIKMYVDFYLSNLIEHKLVRKKDLKDIKIKLTKDAEEKHKIVQKKYKLKNDFGISPEILSLF